MKKQGGEKSHVAGAWEHKELRQKHQLGGGWFGVWCLPLLWVSLLGPEPSYGVLWLLGRMARSPLGHGPEFCLLVSAVLCLEVKNMP